MPQKQTIDVYIGIDPGKNTGIAIWHADLEELEILPAKPFWEAWEEVTLTYPPEEVIAVVEDPTQNRPVFSRGQSRPTREKIAQDIGRNKRDAQLWIAGLERLGFAVRRVRPTQSKWTKKTFERITGYTGRSSEHARDAARMVYGLSPSALH